MISKKISNFKSSVKSVKSLHIDIDNQLVSLFFSVKLCKVVCKVYDKK